MIVLRPSGALGNQMFQYAAARSLSLKHATKLGLDLRWFEQEFPPEATPRKFELDLLKPQYQLVKPTFASRALNKLSPATNYEETTNLYDKHFFQLPSHTVLQPGLVGGFLSEKYFIDYTETIRQDFVWQGSLSRSEATLAAAMQASPRSVAVHIRRGDYVTNAVAQATNGLLGIEYYKAAVRHLEKKLGSIDLYIFSDDIPWCRQNLKLAKKQTFGKRGQNDMRLMAHCHNQVIANSTYSWWGAWLNEDPDKIVITPKRWYADANLDDSDVVPPQWTRL